MKYTTIDLIISGERDSAEVRLISPHGRSPAPVPLNLDLESMPDSDDLRYLSLADLEEAGSNLYMGLVTDLEMRDLFATNRALASEAAEGLRTRFQIDPLPYRNLPWEAINDPPRGFMGLQDVSVTRYIGVGSRPARKLVTQLPLKILVASAVPTNLPPINAEAELERIKAALADTIEKKWVELVVLEHVKRGDLRTTLMAMKPHVLHFIGHGTFADWQAGLAFEDVDGSADIVEPEDLALLMGGITDLRLVVLNACDGALDSSTTPLIGIAPKIIQRTEIPAVIAMQAEILDQAALAFTQAFYTHLAEGREIDTALREGRIAIRNVPDSGAAFAIPVMFLMVEDGIIVDFPQQRRTRVVKQAAASFEAVNHNGGDETTTQIISRWRVHLTNAARLYTQLKVWKILHDLLHEMNEELFNLVLETKRLDKDAPDLWFLEDKWDRIQGEIKMLERFAATEAAEITAIPFERQNGSLRGDPWVVEVVVAAREFQTELAAVDVGKMLRAALGLQRVVKTHMNTSDEALEEVSEQLKSISGGWGEGLPTDMDLAKAIEDLLRLHETLYTAIEKHDIFQELENHYGMLWNEAQRSPIDWETLFSAWSFCRAHVLDSRLVSFGKLHGNFTNADGTLSGDPWLVEVLQPAQELTKNIEDEDERIAIKNLRRFGTAVRTHFFIADKELKEITTTLGGLAGDLVRILER